MCVGHGCSLVCRTSLAITHRGDDAPSADGTREKVVTMRGRKPQDWLGVVLNAPDARALAYFYRDLLEWKIADDDPDWCTMGMPGSPVNLAFQTEKLYQRPTWPAAPDTQQMMLHLDIEVTDLAAAVEDAVALGAELPEHQPQEKVRVLLDPAGHPFCLYLGD